MPSAGSLHEAPSRYGKDNFLLRRYINVHVQRMPKLFEYSNPATERPRFECMLIKVQCQHILANGKRCSRFQSIGAGFCSHHLQTDKCLKIAKSTVPECGLGLFACDRQQPSGAIVFAYHPKRKRGDYVIEYTGEVLSELETANRYGHANTAPYGARLNSHSNIDAACLRGAGSLVNHKQRAHANARLVCAKSSVYIEATKPIRNGDEIFIDYGREYNIGQEGIAYSHRTRDV